MTIESERKRQREQKAANIAVEEQGQERSRQDAENRAKEYAAAHPERNNIRNVDVAELEARIKKLEKK